MRWGDVLAKCNVRQGTCLAFAASCRKTIPYLSTSVGVSATPLPRRACILDGTLRWQFAAQRDLNGPGQVGLLPASVGRRFSALASGPGDLLAPAGPAGGVDSGPAEVALRVLAPCH